MFFIFKNLNYILLFITNFKIELCYKNSSVNKLIHFLDFKYNFFANFYSLYNISHLCKIL